jgi:hypothetical protein
MVDLRAPLTTIAVRAPRSCRSEANEAVEGFGVAARGRTILEARCDVVLGELERALSERHRVHGWRSVAQAEREAGGGPHLAARTLGADAVLMVMDLVALPVLVSDLRGKGVVLTDANPDGSPRGPADLSPRAEETIRELVESHFPDGGLAGVTAELELALQSTAAGELLWTYQRRAAIDLEGARDTKLLVRGRSRTWRPVAPRGHARAEPPPNAEDAVRARLRELAQVLARDVEERLASAERAAASGGDPRPPSSPAGSP